jgi:hypothetical protein
MAITAGNILVGPANVFVGVTAGATGTPPTYITHTAGVPATGTHVGATTGDATFEYKLAKGEIKAEQVFAPIGVYATEESAEIRFMAMEHTYITMQYGFDTAVGKSSTGGSTFYFGGGTGILTPGTACVFLSAINPNAITKFTIAVLYKAYSMQGFKTAFKKSGESVFEIVLRGLADLTRNAGDQLGYYRSET